jgi:Zn-dependent protease
MIKTTYQLCRVFGIPIYLDLSLLVLMFLFVRAYDNPLHGLAAGVLLLVSITLHELGHSLVSMAFGCRVRDITLMIIGGRASLENLPRKYWQEFLVAIAGPAVSLALGLIGLFVPALLLGVGLLSAQIANLLMNALGVLNLVLFGFNLLPAFPMDGGRLLRSALQVRMSKLRATWIASRIGRVLAGIMIFFALCNIFGVNIPNPHLPGIAGRLLWHFLSGGTFIKLLIGWMIFTAADAEYRMVLAEEGAGQRRPFGGIPFFGGQPPPPPPDDSQAVVSPPPYARGRSTRVDVRKEE